MMEPKIYHFIGLRHVVALCIAVLRTFNLHHHGACKQSTHEASPIPWHHGALWPHGAKEHHDATNQKIFCAFVSFIYTPFLFFFLFYFDQASLENI